MLPPYRQYRHQRRHRIQSGFYAAGLIIQGFALQHSNFRSQSSLVDYLKQTTLLLLAKSIPVA